MSTEMVALLVVVILAVVALAAVVLARKFDISLDGPFGIKLDAKGSKSQSGEARATDVDAGGDIRIKGDAASLKKGVAREGDITVEATGGGGHEVDDDPKDQ